MGVDTSELLIANSGNDLPDGELQLSDAFFLFVFKLFLILMIIIHMFLQVIDLGSVSQELAYVASDADLVIVEGMVCK